MPKTTARVLTRDMPDRSRVVATFAVRFIEGNTHAHFSACGEVFEPHGTWSGAARQRNGRDCDACGQVVAEILSAFPDAAPFVRMHLSDYPSGRPMHAAANGRYFAESGDLEASAKTLRVSVDELPTTFEPETWEAFADAQADRWAREAAEAFAWLEGLSS